MGGMFGESKFEVLGKIPSRYVPQTFIVMPATPAHVVLARVKEAGMRLPVILKPDIGERGFMVERAGTIDDIARYLNRVRVPFLVQELEVGPLEFGVFYMRFPGEARGRVVSIVAKEMLSVEGDGISTLQDLILANDRAKLQWSRLKVRYAPELDRILAAGEKLELVSIGNHAMGTKFINANSLISDKLSATFDLIAREIEGFYFGRFDLRCKSVEDLEEGRIRILELNGCGAEPAHIYDRGFSLLRASAVLLKHWGCIFEIARQNNRKGVPYISHREALAYYRKFKSAIR